mmetsp:Transcript_33896/g.30679  ORF Transcript_33896/g.30679 Transcript_33896/m.30679 type:complete len:94 (-) Transcript_33896:160-441(-)
MNYSLVINGQEPFYLPLETEHHSRIPINDREAYAFRLEHEGKFIIELKECLGSLGMTITNNSNVLHGDEVEMINNYEDFYTLDEHVIFRTVEI